MSTSKPTIVAKARLTNFGKGSLEIRDGTLRFYVETGRFKKQRRNIVEIPLKEIEGIERKENDLTVTWKENMNTFVVEQASQVDAIYDRINVISVEEKKESETDKTVLQSKPDLTQTTTNVVETIYSLFALLKQLHGQVNWKDVDSDYKIIEENTTKLANQTANPIKMDITQLQLTVHEHRPKEIAESTYDILKTLYEHFDELSSNEDLEKTHSNSYDIKLMLQTIYILNDVALGIAVGDEHIEKEVNEFIKVLNEFAKLPGASIDIPSIKSSLNKLIAGKGKQTETFDDIRLKINQQTETVMKTQRQ